MKNHDIKINQIPPACNPTGLVCTQQVSAQAFFLSPTENFAFAAGITDFRFAFDVSQLSCNVNQCTIGSLPIEIPGCGNISAPAIVNQVLITGCLPFVINAPIDPNPPTGSAPVFIGNQPTFLCTQGAIFVNILACLTPSEFDCSLFNPRNINAFVTLIHDCDETVPTARGGVIDFTVDFSNAIVCPS